MNAGDDVRRGRGLRDDERSIWERLTRSVVPLKRMPVRPDRAPDIGSPINLRTEKRATAATRPVASKMGAKPAAKPAPPLAPIDRRARQRLARGTDAIDARIDLHGMTQSRAHVALSRFLRDAQVGGARFVLVITGKGGGAAGWEGERGVLKRQVPLWLALPEFRTIVLGFQPAHASHGGEGALYVRLRRAR